MSQSARHPLVTTDVAELLRQEAAAIAGAAERLDQTRFAEAVRLLERCSGNVATVGAGTSGIAARKIAATLTSTGTPALFVHPADALHGGLGAIGGQEVVIAVSKSGETEEVLSLLPYLRTREVPVIAIVGSSGSTLARGSAVTLEAYAEREAGRYDLVPTASVAVALAIGDALALTVMEAKGVTPERFAANHPSGSLGRRLTLRVRDVMHDLVAGMWVTPDAPLVDVVTAMSSSGLGGVAILDPDGGLSGIITDGDVRRAVQRCEPATLGKVRAQEIMTADPITIGAEAMAYDALRVMEDRPSQIGVMPVAEGGRCLGLVRLHDLVRIGLSG
jgi:arabinose-5-phosphate isomerase